MAASDLPPSLEESLENNTNATLGSGGSASPPPSPTSPSVSITKVKPSSSCTYAFGSSQYHTASALSQVLLNKKLSAIYKPLMDVGKTVWGSDFDPYTTTTTQSNIVLSTQPSTLFDCSATLQSLSNAVPLMECYFDILTAILGNFTTDTVHNTTSAWTAVRQLVYDAYANIVVINNLRGLVATFPCTKTAASVGCAVNYDDASNDQYQCSSPQCLNTKYYKYAVVSVPVAVSFHHIEGTITRFTQLCLVGGKKN